MYKRRQTVPVLTSSSTVHHRCVYVGIGASHFLTQPTSAPASFFAQWRIPLADPPPPCAHRRGPQPKTRAGLPAHLSVVSARCPYLIGHIEAARKSSPSPSPSTPGYGSRSRAVELCLEHASADTVALLVRYLYTDDIPAGGGVSGEVLNSLAGLARELLLPRCVGFSYGLSLVRLLFFRLLFFGGGGGGGTGHPDCGPFCSSPVLLLLVPYSIELPRAHDQTQQWWRWGFAAEGLRARAIDVQVLR